MACSKYLQDKYRKYFHFLDVNKDGFLTREDFDAIGQNMLAHNGGDDNGIRMQKEIEKWWPKFEAMKPDGKLDEDDFVRVIKSFYEGNFDKFRQDQIKRVQFFFDIIDRNKDNLISLDEYQLYYSCFNVTKMKKVEEVFKKIDLDGDGFISREEWAVAWANYTMCDDPRIGYTFLFDI